MFIRTTSDYAVLFLYLLRAAYSLIFNLRVTACSLINCLFCVFFSKLTDIYRISNFTSVRTDATNAKVCLVVGSRSASVAPSVLWCCWLGLLTCKIHYRVGEPTAAWQFVDIRQHRSFDNGRQYVSCGQWQPPLTGAPVNKMAVNYHEGETDPSGFRVWLNSSSLRDTCLLI